jgi:hypothetical protein
MGKYQLGDVSVVGRTILNCILKTGFEDVDWIHLILVNTIMNSGFHRQGIS